MEVDEKNINKNIHSVTKRSRSKINNSNAEKEQEKDAELQPVAFLQLFRFTSTSDRMLLLLGTMSAFIASACFPALNILFGLMAELMVEMETPEVFCNDTIRIYPTSTDSSLHDDEKMSQFLSDLSMFSIYLVIIGTIQLVFGYAFVCIFIRVAEHQIYRIRKLYFESLLRQDISWYDTVEDRNFVSKISEDIGKVQEAIGDKVGQSAYYACSSIICLGSSFWFGWELTLVILATSPIIAIASIAVASFQSKLALKEQQEYAKSGKTSQEALQNIKTVMAFGRQQTEITRYEKDLVFALRAGKRRGIVSAFGEGFLWFLNYASYSLAFWYGTKLIFDGRENMCEQKPEYGTADMLIVFFNVLTGSFHIGTALSYLDVFSVGRGAAAAIYAVIDRTPDIDSYSDTGRNPSKRLTGKIDFKNIHFSYPSRIDVKVLTGFNLSVEPGTTVALVGNSGCGKSTCLQLLQRFYDPNDDGMVCVDDLDIRGFNLNWYRSQIGVVSQEPVLFNTTIAENIRYGREDATKAEIEEACRLSNALTFITKLPNGFETIVGDRGASLSGGQKQRIALARALVRNPSILLLDEATSALDTSSEAIVQAALDEARKGRTTFIVAHRLSTIRSADLIVSLQNGKVVEMGTHEELLEKKGLYFNLVTTQMTGGMSSSSQEVEETQTKNNESISSPQQKLSIAEVNEELEVTETNYEDSDSDETLSKKGVVVRLIKMNMKEWPLISLGLIMSIGHGCILPLYAFFFGDFLGVLSMDDSEEARHEANYYAFAFLFIGVAAGVTIFVSTLCFSFAGEMFTTRLRKMAFSTMLQQELGWYDNPKNSVGALCMRLAGDAASVQGATGNRLGTIVHAFTTIAISVGLALIVLPKLGAVAIAFVPFILVAAFFSGKRLENQQIEEKMATEEASKIAFQAVTNIRTVASLCKEKAFLKLYTDALLSPHIKALKNSHVTGFVYGLSQALMYYAYASVMYYGGVLIRDENIDYTRVFIIGEALIWSMLMLGRTLAFAPNYHKAKISGSRILKLLDRRSEMDISLGTGLQMKSSQGSIIFNNVHFSYPTRKTAKILRGINFGVEPGQKVAVVGPSGSGKSTCIQLILRFYDPVIGQVKLDEVDVAAVNINSLRSQMAIVAQEPALFDRTLAENIAYGYSDHSVEVSMEKIIQAARQANIHSFISALPAGYETRVGEAGSHISGGQRQRIAIARALIRDPKVLLLDEATSALDSESEAVVQSALDLASAGRSSITIAHRLSTVQNADKILVVSNGVLCESGSHSELLDQRGIYYKLWKIQGRRD